MSVTAIVYLIYGWKTTKKANRQRSLNATASSNTGSSNTDSLRAPLLAAENTEHPQSSDTSYMDRNVCIYG